MLSYFIAWSIIGILNLAGNGDKVSKISYALCWVMLLLMIAKQL